MCNFTVFVKDDREFSPNEEIDSSEWLNFEEAHRKIKPASLAQKFLNAYLDEIKNENISDSAENREG
jgi:NADH pyrophosphatase NudC (nudix superfamily)